jgi:Zn finger protein HypA/HybF involved in hydrogenase expression
VQADVKPGRTAREVAERHGLTPRAVEHAFARGTIARPANVNPIERKCLCCSRLFITDTPFIRSCSACREKGSPLDMFVAGG